MSYRNTPHSIIGKRPAESQSRDTFDDLEVRDQDNMRKHKYVEKINETRTDYGFKVGDLVQVKRDGHHKWKVCFIQNLLQLKRYLAL